MTRLIEFKRPKERFARSINVERDTGSAAIEGYLPVGRAIESIDRLAQAMLSDSAEVALSITGPYGSGKSSLALVIDSLFAPVTDPAGKSAKSMLAAAAPETMGRVQQAIARAEATESGFIRAVVTAQREPIAQTVVRALLHGAQRFVAPRDKQQTLKRAVKLLKELNATLSGGSGRVDTRAIRDLVRTLSEVGPILLLIDEFGKNLEAFAERPGDGDLFLLQELAEWTRRGAGSNLALVTLQHMAFGDYADGASAVQRREWVKIQGRFEDIPFVDTAAQTLSLVAASFEDVDGAIGPRVAQWAAEQSQQMRSEGLTELAPQTDLLAQCWPLHPLALAVLPELCQRYGQNERTMFSFLASSEPRSVSSFLRETELSTSGGLPSVHLDRLYDYFLESASSMVSVSADASRWLEIDTRIRDAHGLSASALRVLKTVGLLNLVSAGGSLRASGSMLRYAASDGLAGTANAKEVQERLGELETAGLVTYREFADEFRVWQGSDFDLKSAITVARRRLRDERPGAILQRVLPLGPLVAARHSHETGTLRAFERGWTDGDVPSIEPLTSRDRGDGLLLYVLDGPVPTHAVRLDRTDKPVVFASTEEPLPVLEAARELAAIDEVMATDEDVRTDWVARKELAERRVAAATALHAEFEKAFGGTSLRSRWHWVKSENVGKSGRIWRKINRQSPSAVLSDVADSYYSAAPRVRNDLINRHELSSQAAKARREVVEVMGTREHVPGLGIEGFGPDRTLYLSVLEDLDLHAAEGEGASYRAPSAASSVQPVWGTIVGRIRTSTRARLNVSDLYDELALPPYGLRPGVVPILFVAALRLHKDEFALYEHGTFRPTFSGDVAERLLRNPNNFEVKSFASGSGPRRRLIESLASALGASTLKTSAPTVVSVVSSLVARINMLPAYSKKTVEVSPVARELRTALLEATEPDVLVFERIPRAVGHAVVAPGAVAQADAHAIATLVITGLQELSDAYPALVAEIRTKLTAELRVSGEDYRASLQRRAAEIADKVIDPRVKSLVAALRAGIPDEEPWLEYVGMQITGVPPQAWSDEDRRRFRSVLSEASGTFKRVEALNADMRSHEGEFDAVRVHLNWSHGHEAVKLVVWDERTRENTQSVVTRALDELAVAAGSREGAADWLMAALADQDWQRRRADETSAINKDDQGHGETA